ncbi:MAG: hypothetical protein ABR598_02115 [Candidatus Dormibacteria bacterium]
MASQGSDKLKAIIAEARDRAEAARAAGPAPRTAAETRRIEALLDRGEALPDPRALARLYQSKELVEKLPDDEDETPSTQAPPSDAAPGRPPLSPAQVREVMSELTEQFTANTYMTYEAKPLPEDVIPVPEEAEAFATEEPNELFYLAGAIVAIVVIGVFVLLALNGPLRYRPPAGGATPSPSVTPPR